MQKCLAYSVSEKEVAEVTRSARLLALCAKSVSIYASKLGGPVSNEQERSVKTLDYTITG